MVTRKTKKPLPKSKVSARRKITSRLEESDGTYFLKLVVVVLAGTLWLKFRQPLIWQGIPFGAFPLGMLLGVVGVSLFEKNQFDRKIWYAVLVIVTIICYFLPAGVVIP